MLNNVWTICVLDLYINCVGLAHLINMWPNADNKSSPVLQASYLFDGTDACHVAAPQGSCF